MLTDSDMDLYVSLTLCNGWWQETLQGAALFKPALDFLDLLLELIPSNTELTPLEYCKYVGLVFAPCFCDRC